jgi:hypothetical protein
VVPYSLALYYNILHSDEDKKGKKGKKGKKQGKNQSEELLKYLR